MSESPQLEYAIRRLNWRRAHYGIVRMPGTVTIGALPTLEEAEADRARREAEVRSRVNPFICGSTHSMRSRMPEQIFHDWLRDVGLEPPALAASLPRAWADWWTELFPSLTPEQREHVWNGLDRVRFFEVAARPEGSVGYAVVGVQWEYNDSWYEPGAEGGAPFKVFRQWAAAEEYRRKLEEQQRAYFAPDTDYDNPARYETTRWTDEAFWPFGPPPKGGNQYENTTFAHGGEATYYEIVEVELSDLPVVAS